jgi:FlaA1/EpsC-like NDP-sugar epimerase
MGSRGSVLPFFFDAAGKDEPLQITDPRMTRFMITLEEGVELVWTAFEDMVGGEIYVKKIPSMTITDIAEAVAPGKPTKIVGIRPGEKLHEQMIGVEDAPTTYEYDGYFKILPAINLWDRGADMVKAGKSVPEDFVYTSDQNSAWMTIPELQAWIERNLVNKSVGAAPSALG